MTAARRDPWPDDHASALVVTVEFEGLEYFRANTVDGDRRDKSRSVFTYGIDHGVAALLDRFATAETPTTWFVPGAVADEHRDLLRRIHAGGHEVGLSGLHDPPLDQLDADRRREVLRRGRDAIAAVVGTPPVGFRLAAGAWPPGLGETLASLGFTWSSSLGGDDVPYFLPTPSGDLVEIPRSPAMNDRIAFFWNFSPPFPASQTRIASYAGTVANWGHELRGAVREGLCTVLDLHPEIIATPARRLLVDEFLDVAGVAPWRATGHQVASWWRTHHEANEPHHPLSVYLHGSGHPHL